jgi:16S rRNA A1518/A1519 N6-dimethyltransferase RsmA/KsgA/DIM1 with predicted DNA glycosylase/AP lyase activity
MVFDEVAAGSDRHRPAYPDELVDQACRVARIGSGDRVLEVGRGSGNRTRSLLARGLHVTALEPGKNLIALARDAARRRGLTSGRGARPR